MPHTKSFPAPPANRLLARLPNGEYRRILPQLQSVELKFKQTLYHAKSPIEYVYFPTRGVASTVAYVGDGDAIEVSTVGDEGMVGLPALLGEATSPNEVFMQVAGDGLRIPAATLRKEAG